MVGRNVWSMPPTTPGGDHRESTDTSAPLPALVDNLGPRFPEPHVLTRQLANQYERWLAELRAGRQVTRPEDVHNSVRLNNRYRLRALEYARAFTALADRIEDALKEELIEAVGEKKPGEPARKMVVPDDGWEISLVPQYNTDRDIDMDQIAFALTLIVLDEWAAAGRVLADDAETTGDAQEFACEIARRAVALHRKTEPSIKAVQALATLAGAKGDDSTAATINSAVSETRRTYKDVKVEYKPAS